MSEDEEEEEEELDSNFEIPVIFKLDQEGSGLCAQSGKSGII